MVSGEGATWRLGDVFEDEIRDSFSKLSYVIRLIVLRHKKLCGLCGKLFGLCVKSV